MERILKCHHKAAAFNEDAKQISGDNVRIAEAITKAALEATKAERLRNDTAYQKRCAAFDMTFYYSHAGRDDLLREAKKLEKKNSSIPIES